MKVQNDGDWKSQYFQNDESLYRDIDREFGWDLGDEEYGRYEFVFDYEGVRRYCFVDASSLDEAIGSFLRHHSSLSYDYILEHLEV